MYSHLYVGRILREGGTQPRKAKDSMSVQILSCPKEAIPNPVFLPKTQVSQSYLSRAGSPPARSFKADNYDFFLNYRPKYLPCGSFSGKSP